MAKPITKSQKRLFILLGLVAAYAVYDLTTGKKETTTDKKKSSDVQTAGIADSTIDVIESVMRPRPLAASFGSWKRDPFRGQVSTGSRVNFEKVMESLLIPKMANFNLTAISRRGDASFALINDQVLGVGDQINGFRVIEIRSDKVVLQKNNFTFNVSLPDDEALF